MRYNKIPTNIKIIIFEDVDYYNKPWEYITGLEDLEMNVNFSEDFNPNVKPEDIVNMYKRKKS